MPANINSPHSGKRRDPELDALMRKVEERVSRGLAPPAEVYRLPIRNHVDWSRVPEWARPVDPEMFEGCGHEG